MTGKGHCGKAAVFNGETQSRIKILRGGTAADTFTAELHELTDISAMPRSERARQAPRLWAYRPAALTLADLHTSVRSHSGMIDRTNHQAPSDSNISYLLK